ncbi:MAG: anthranilate synthase component I [Candidatus Hydrogenedentota bacterium]|nr:MAG: anthranilate synthase component I [Candidatus Hydrogenedentota bacterium]
MEPAIRRNAAKAEMELFTVSLKRKKQPMLSLTEKEFLEVATKFNVIPLVRSVVLDLETPVGLYIRSGAWRTPYSFLLESVTGGENLGRYSILGTQAYAIVSGKNHEFFVEKNGRKKSLSAKDPIEALREAMQSYRLYEDPSLSGFYSGATGYFSYDMIRYYETIEYDTHNLDPEKRKPKKMQDPLKLPDLVFVIPQQVIWLDHAMGKMNIIENIFIEENEIQEKESLQKLYHNATERINKLIEKVSSDSEWKEFRKHIPRTQAKAQWTSNVSREEYANIVERCKEYIKAGDIFQVVPSRRFQTSFDHHPFFLYRGLRATNPSPYMFYLNFPEGVLAGSSPEILVKKEGNEVILRPIAGTIHRGSSPAEDAALSQKLLSDEKEIAEHVMLVDLGRNDVGRVSLYGSVHVDELMVIEKYSHVMHIVSNVRGRIRPDFDAYDCLKVAFPAGTVSGAPKVRAMQIIEEMEPEKRGFYAGCVGYFSLTGDMDTAITLRSILYKDGIVYVQAGGGLVYDSDPEKENQEVENKAAGPMKAVQMVLDGEFSRTWKEEA